jgi:hypothetical protein
MARIGAKLHPCNSEKFYIVSQKHALKRIKREHAIFPKGHNSYIWHVLSIQTANPLECRFLRKKFVKPVNEYKMMNEYEIN